MTPQEDTRNRDGRQVVIRGDLGSCPICWREPLVLWDCPIWESPHDPWAICPEHKTKWSIATQVEFEFVASWTNGKLALEELEQPSDHAPAAIKAWLDTYREVDGFHDYPQPGDPCQRCGARWPDRSPIWTRAGDLCGRCDLDLEAEADL